MDALFNKSTSTFFHKFLDNSLEEKYENYIRTKSNTSYNLVGLIVMLAQLLIGTGMMYYQLFLSFKGDKRYILSYELSTTILTTILFGVDVLLFFTGWISKLRGCFLILGVYVQIIKTASTLLNSFGIAIGGLGNIGCTFFIGISYNKFFIYPSISIIISIISFFLTNILLINKNMTIFQLIVLIIICLFIAFWNINLFYNSEYTLRRDYFMLYLSRQKQKLVSTVIEEMPISIIYMKNKNVDFVNKSFKQMVGLPILPKKKENRDERVQEKQLYLEACAKIKRDVDQKSLRECIEEDETMETVNKYPYSLSEKDNNYSLKIKGVGINEINNLIEIYVMEDVGQLLRIEKETSKKYQKILIASVSHEILTPTNGCIGLLDSALEMTSDPKLIKKLRIVQISCVKLTFFLNLLKDYTLLETNSITITKCNFNIIESIQNCIKIFQKDIKKKGITLKLHFERSIMVLNSDQYKFNQIIFILLSNAAKHCFTGFIEIHVKYNQDEEIMQLIVEDTGTGISSENLPNIFTLFSKTTERSEINPQGIGMPLYICKKYLELLKGSISVESEINKGTRFNISIPVGKEVDQNLSEGFENINSARPLFPGNKYSLLHSFDEEASGQIYSLVVKQNRALCTCNHFLIVDDDTTNIKVLKSYFHSFGIKADSAFNGQIALFKIEEQNSKKCCDGYRLVLMDLNMPVMDGEQATRLAQEKIKSGLIKPCTIIAITATHLYGEEHKQKFIEAGFSDVYSKPISKKIFEQIISNYV